MAVAFIFPGQGSQAIGMGKGLFDAYPASAQIFEEVDEALGEKLSELIFSGDPAQLQLTANAQPALMAVSLAALRALESEKGVVLARDAKFVAGHSLGEYSALAAAGALKISDAARLLRLRGKAMQAAVKVGEGAMAALIGAEPELALKIAGEAAAASGATCEVANDNGGGQIVVSGAKGAVELAIEIAKANGVKRALLLPVSAPFHCALMQPAADAMRDALAATEIRPPVVDLVANVTAGPVRDPDEIRNLLVAQVCGKVRWRESMGFMHDNGVNLFVEIGAGKVLAGLVKRTAEGARSLNVGIPAEVDSFQLTA
ncbi:ACP S-malonyltransferase [uncultured Rhodoblastus sp.]|uniref:ACP S-malonyltransferase n=1 Tax=uncultured Rhodoblastus sp. TaxID=543037 RepID=UPI0025CB7D00|nr:ACP S-malonyltransferase [uncultured Rhodoblastus sp.]